MVRWPWGAATYDSDSLAEGLDAVQSQVSPLLFFALFLF